MEEIIVPHEGFEIGGGEVIVMERNKKLLERSKMN